MAAIRIATVVALSALSTAAYAAPCTKTRAQEKAKAVAVVVDETSFEREDVIVVTSGNTFTSAEAWTFSVQVRKDEIGGNVYDVAVNKASCLIESVALSNGLE